MPSNLTDLARIRTVSDLGRHIAAVARVRTGADEAEVWTREADGRLRSLESTRVVRRPEELGFSKLPAEGDARTAPGAWRGLNAWRALPLRWGDEDIGVLALGYTHGAPILSLLQRDLADVLPAWALALDRLLARSEVADIDAVASARVGAGLAHTLSNVLQAAISSTEAARFATPPGNDPVHGPLADALDALRRAAALIQQLAVLGGQAAEPVPTEIRSLVAGLAAALRLQMPTGIELVLDTPGNDEAWVLVDRGAIEATLAGVVYAAREALGSVGSIHMATRVEGDEHASERTVVMEVRRQPGRVSHAMPLLGTIPPIPMPDNHGGDTVGAERLGLTFARAAVERYGGAVTERSVGGGAVVTMTFPEVRLAPKRSISGTLRRVREGGPLRVLVADDEPVVLRAMTRLLVQARHEVLPARDGAEALDIARTTPGIDVALIDLTMPRLAGPALVAALRRVAPWTPVVVMTGYASDAMVEALRREGVVAVLRKPVELQHFLTAIGDAAASAVV